ncbi:MAG: hypothetical protein IT374_11630 [Polyangiaceae bacterium]|nr:hypothetical protein [Polyangiaceae bacterium]
MRSLKSRATVATILFALGGFQGCAEERPDIDRTQPNALDKSFFLGADLASPADDPVFYSRYMVVDHSVGQANFTMGLGGGLDKIRWEVTENMLIGRKAYQPQPGRDNKGLEGPGSVPNGTVVASYRIISHFDIRRGYNPTTGEQTNVLDENTTDRPWNERQYMRVDWSSNEVVNPMEDEFFFSAMFGDGKVTPLRYWVSDPASDEAPVFDFSDGYFDVTNRYWVEPGMVEFSWGKLPSCALQGWIGGTALKDCNAQEASIRRSFWKVQDTDFEPMPLPPGNRDIVANFGGAGNSFQSAYGPPLQAYDPQYGYTDKNWVVFANKHNIWKKSHIPGSYCDSAADADDDGTHDQCEFGVMADQDGILVNYEGSSGSRCDVISHKCTIPYRDREVKTVPYYTNPEFGDEYLDKWDGVSAQPETRGAAEDVVYSWNQMMRASVSFTREAECRRTGEGSREDCHALYFNSTDDPATKVMVSYGGWLIDDSNETAEVFTVCHNPIRPYDNPVCGPAGQKIRVGEIRRRYMVNWPHDASARYGGVAALVGDPETGEAIGNTATTVYIERRANRLLQALLVAMGDISLQDYLDGVPGDIVARTLSATRPEAVKPVSLEEIDARIKAIDVANLARSAGKSPALEGATPAQERAARLRSMAMTGDAKDARAQALAQLHAAASPIRGTKVAAGLVDSETLSTRLGMDPTTPLSPEVVAAASPLDGLEPGKLAEVRAFIAARNASLGLCFGEEIEAASPEIVVNASLAKHFKDKYAALSREERAQKILAELIPESFKGVMLHEFGHSLGMRHQFASSFDSKNYMPQYWQLRTNGGKATGKCAPGQAPDTCMGPRYVDPETDDELGLADESRPNILYFANTSTMEYQSERFSETSGLGTWDYHMSKAIYGGVLETFDPKLFPRSRSAQYELLHYTQLADANLVDPSLSPTITLHYTNLARSLNLFDMARDCRDATPEEKAKAEWRVVHNKVCAPISRDHAHWDEFLSDVDQALTPLFGSPTPLPKWHTKPGSQSNPAKGEDRVRWHYRYGENYSSAHIHANLTDAGADMYELATNTVRYFDANYPSRYFRKKQRGFNDWTTASAVSDYDFERLRSYHWSAATDFLRTLSANNGQGDLEAAIQNDDDAKPAALANVAVFNALARAVLIPQPGDYRVRQPVAPGDPEVWEASPTPFAGAAFNVPLIDGRYVDSEYDTSAAGGGSWMWQQRLKRAGFSVEKAYAFLALTDSRPTLSTISRDNFLDGRAPALNFRSDLPDAFDRLMGGMLSEDWAAVGMYVSPSAGGQATVLDLTSKTPTRPADAKVLFPNVGYLQQLYATIFSALYARVDTDMTLVNKMRIWADGLEGSISNLGIPNPKDQVRFVDPETGITYIAHTYGTEKIAGRDVERGIASRMVIRANELLAASYETEVDGGGAVKRNSFGSPILKIDPVTKQPIRKDPSSAPVGHFRKYVGLIDSVRQIGQILGQGPL